MTVGENIRRKRRKAGYTQWEFSRLVGIRQGTLLLIERGQTTCPKQLLETIAQTLGVKSADLRK